MKKSRPLQGFSLPLSPKGESNLVPPPPWFFGGESTEVIYETNSALLATFLPAPLSVVPKKAWVSVTMTDMISVSEKNEAITFPERSQYQECLIKLYCEYQNKQYWFVPISWVTADFSLMRGFVMGFGKKMGCIHITKYHELNPLLGKLRRGSIITAQCDSPHNIRITSKITLLSRSTTEVAPVSGMCVIRHYPDFGLSNAPSQTQLVCLEVDMYQKEHIWHGKGEISIDGREEICQLQPRKIIAARIASEGFRLKGVRSLI